MLWPWGLPRSAAVGRLGPAEALAEALGELPPALALGAAALGAVVAVPPPLLHAAKTNAAVPAKARSLLLNMLFLLLHGLSAVGDG
jgi:hypothetical protein